MHHLCKRQHDFRLTERDLQKLHHLIIGQFSRTDQKTFQHSGTGAKTMHTLSPVQLRHLAFKDLFPVLARAQLLLCFGFFAAEIGNVGFRLGQRHHAPLQNKEPNNQICFVLIVWLGKTCMIFAVYSNSFRKSFIYVFDKLSRLKIQLHRIWQSSITISILRGDYVTVLSFLEAYRGIFSICLPLQ